MLRLTTLAAGLMAASVLTLVPAGNANAARFHDPGVQAPSMVDDVACRVVRERIVRNGRVTYRTRNVCTSGRPHYSGRNCRTIRERIVRPNGSVVYRSVQRCR